MEKELTKDQQMDDTRKALMSFVKSMEVIKTFALEVSSILKLHDCLIIKIAKKLPLEQSEMRDAFREMQAAELRMFEQVKEITQMAGVKGVSDLQKLWSEE